MYLKYVNSMSEYLTFNFNNQVLSLLFHKSKIELCNIKQVMLKALPNPIIRRKARLLKVTV